MTRGELLAFLSAQPWAVEARLDREGQPQAVVIGVAATKKLELVFDTLSDSRKAANSRGSPRVALVMGWDDGQTAQIEGIVDEPVGDELQQLKDVYWQRFPDRHQRAALEGMAHFRVSPVWTRHNAFRTTPPTVVVFDAEELQHARGDPR